MKFTTLLVIGLCSSLAVTSAVGGEDSEITVDGAGEAPRTATAEPASTTEMAETQAGADAVVGGAKSAAAVETKRASTATGAKHIYDQVKKGNVKIQGATDADIYE